MSNPQSQLPKASTLRAVYAATAGLLFIVYLIVYQYAPFTAEWNDALLKLDTPLAATIVAAIAAAIYLHYHPQDLPRKVWLNLMTGSWLWAGAEIFWTALDADLSVADAAWVGGFVFFTLAFYHQYALAFPSQKNLILTIAAGAWALALSLPLLFFLSADFTFLAYLDYYYPIADFLVAAAGLALMFVFRGGALLRPWIGLVVFGVSDLIYAWANQAGYYETIASLTLAIDASYLAAYLIFGYGFLSHWLLLVYGLQEKR